MSEIDNRRPLKVRDATLSQRFARWLSQKSVTPNQISTASVFFAILAAGCLLAMPHVEGAAVWVARCRAEKPSSSSSTAMS